MSDALDLLAALVLEDGRRWGEAAVPCQWEDARAVLDPSSATPLHWLGRARGYSKTTDLGGMAIVAMLAQKKRRLPESSYLRLFENEWVASEDRLANEDDLAACVTLDGPVDPRRLPGTPHFCGKVITIDYS